ncbi:hypothetical protein QJ850_gp136 [Acanthamoeba polyphaga mimivirus]|uniref:Uncharacterized protein n=1 Tax=Acanthamoeba polyphaga mimivirus Kroon TaxID=3069720 RepID=A0A0G2Y439_9VIRU|nr:hypothetical protein QJ850_gp136 [Acanthamoeba polyphaga mimivirus]AKI80563.1 hypothetical protein [Acanthamoeba polyphaga mimivirus Kroon]
MNNIDILILFFVLLFVGIIITPNILESILFIGIVFMITLKIYINRVNDKDINKLVLSDNVKIVIFVPETHADIIIETLGKAGAGCIKCYDFCSFTTKGIGRYRSLEGSSPTIGNINEFTSCEEIKIETFCPRNKIAQIIQITQKVHPYETMGYDLYPMLNLSNNF